MRKTLRGLVAVISIIVAVLAIVSFVYRLGDLRTSGERSSGAEYSILRNALMSLQTEAELQDRFLRERLMALYKGSDRLLAAQVLDSSGMAVWKIPSGSSYFALPNDTSVRSGFSAPEGSTVIFTTPLGGGMKLSAIYATMRKADISQAAKVPVIISAIWCLAVALAIVLLGGDDGKSSPSKKGDISKPETEPEPAETPADASAANEASAKVSSSAAFESVEEDEADKVEDAENGDERLTDDFADEIPDLLLEADSPDAEEDEKAESVDRSPIAAPRAASPRPEAQVQPISDAARSGRSFEESLAKLEEEIVGWSSRHGDQPGRAERKNEVPPKAEEAAASGGQENDLDAEINEELDELEAPPEDELAADSESDLADSRETLQEFEELRAEEKTETAVPTSESSVRAPASSSERQDIASLPMPLSLGDSQLEARLSEELGRGASTEVSLMLIHCTVSSRSDPAAVALAVTIKDYIGSKDLIFELYKGAFAVVLPSVDLGGALKMSEDLADVLSATLSLYKDLEGEPPVFIGISARSERNVDAYKIYREASTAVHKAYSGSHSRILAFRPKTD
ncbi:MAG TPA: hypothetical protein VN445_02625 [Rectinemataceae bacterium]|nr:hypothetical protein [Rectinemataceae bacterium]